MKGNRKGWWKKRKHYLNPPKSFKLIYKKQRKAKERACCKRLLYDKDVIVPIFKKANIWEYW